MRLKTPKNWDTESIDKVVEPANEYFEKLQKTTKKEVGYLLRYDSKSNHLYADFFIGKDESTWLNLIKSPYNKPLKDSEMIIGFVHTHPSGTCNKFGPDDLSSISNFSLGNYKWTNIPKMAKFQIDRGWEDKIKSTKVLHNNPNTIHKMYFGVLHSEGYDSFSWKLTDSKYLPGMYHNIWLMGSWRQYVDFLNNPQNYGAVFIKKRR